MLPLCCAPATLLYFWPRTLEQSSIATLPAVEQTPLVLDAWRRCSVMTPIRVEVKQCGFCAERTI
jgi:hypothetical protein